MSAGTVELQRMVVRLVGDSSSYKRMMNDARSITKQATDAMSSELAGVYRDAQGRLRAANGRFLSDLEKQRLGLAEVRKEADRTSSAIGRLASTLAKTGGRGIKSLGSNVVMPALNLGATAVAGAGVGGLGFGLKLAADAEQAKISFKTMLGSAADAKKMIADLNNFAASTPFEIAGLTDATKKLLAYGIEQQKIIPTLRQIGDISAGLNIPLGELADLYGKARTQGTLFAEDINQLTGRGIPVIREFAKQLGVTESEVKKLASEGKINFGHLQKAFEDLTAEGSMFGGLMEEQSKSLAGRWSTAKDELFQTLAAIGAEIAETFDLKTVLVDVADFFKSIRGQVKEIVGWVKALDQGIDDLALRAAAWVQGIDPEPIIKTRMQLRELTEDAEFLNKEIEEALGSVKIPKLAADIKTQWDESAFDTSDFQIDLSGMDLKPLTDKQREEMLARVNEITKAEEAAAKEAVKMQEQHRKAISDTVKALKDQVATYGMGAKELALYEAAQKGASEAQKAVISSLYDQLAAKEAATKATEDAAHATDEAREAEKRFRDSMRFDAIDAVGRGFDALARVGEFRDRRASGRDNPLTAPKVVSSSGLTKSKVETLVNVLGKERAEMELHYLKLMSEGIDEIAKKDPVEIKAAGIGG